MDIEQQKAKNELIDKFGKLTEFDLSLDENLLRDVLEENELDFLGITDGRKYNVDSLFNFEFRKKNTKDKMHLVGIGIKYVPGMDLNEALINAIKRKKKDFGVE